MRKVFSTHQFDKGKGKNHIIFICDHASNLIPKCYLNLGLQKKLLKSHIAWDRRRFLRGNPICASLILF